jgi:hypothetical protein
MENSITLAFHKYKAYRSSNEASKQLRLAKADEVTSPASDKLRSDHLFASTVLERKIRTPESFEIGSQLLTRHTTTSPTMFARIPERLKMHHFYWYIELTLARS